MGPSLSHASLFRPQLRELLKGNGQNGFHVFLKVTSSSLPPPGQALCFQLSLTLPLFLPNYTQSDLEALTGSAFPAQRSRHGRSFWNMLRPRPKAGVPRLTGCLPGARWVCSKRCLSLVYVSLSLHSLINCVG